MILMIWVKKIVRKEYGWKVGKYWLKHEKYKKKCRKYKGLFDHYNRERIPKKFRDLKKNI